MRVAVVQTQPAACQIAANIKAHETWVKKVAGRGADMVFFPELSLLGYEPKHAARFAMRADDVRLDVFQMLSHALRITRGTRDRRLALRSCAAETPLSSTGYGPNTRRAAAPAPCAPRSRRGSARWPRTTRASDASES